jgi:hypothetical protein
VVVGYGVFGWVGALGGFLALGFLAAGRLLKQKRYDRRTADRGRGLPGRGCRCPAGGVQRARLEALLRKAHLLAETFHDAYGARNCCLEIIRQTEKEDPLFMAAYALFVRTMALPPMDRPVPDVGRDSISHGIPMDIVLPGDANVIPFPLSPSRR